MRIFVFCGAFLYILCAEGNPCKTKAKCSECLNAHANCAWCTKVNFTEQGKFRCDFLENLERNNCSGKFIMNPENKFLLEKAEPLSLPGVIELKTVVQIEPQIIKLKLRPKKRYNIGIKFRQYEDYPVDLYYLMDLSNTMSDDKEYVAEIGALLAESMNKITKNFRLGFGSFVDKVLDPFTSTVPAKLRSPCPNCVPTYGFKNHLPLSLDIDRFAMEVRKANVSGNVDTLEGGLDALMQVIVCNKEIGWREKARKIVVFSTDAGFHFAGDGKLCGIVKPNDGLCHLNKEGVYYKSSVQDYPSINQLRHKMAENKIFVIFAVSASQERDYFSLSKQLQSAVSSELASDSHNIVDLVRDQYNKMSSSVVLKDNATSEIKINYYSKCLGTELEETNICKGLKVGHTVLFNVSIEIAECSENPKRISFSPVGVNELLHVYIEMICKCECENPSNVELNSPLCNGRGTNECGTCSCYDRNFGNHCQCNSNDSEFLPDSDNNCRMSNISDICSGRGTCSCGGCVCHERAKSEEQVYGRHCECDNFSCERINGQVCSGEDHGKCECNECECASGWTGKACECTEDTYNCIGRDGKLCSGHGQCKCGVCKCNDLHSGPFCEECPICAGKCSEFKSCVQCTVFKNGQMKHNCTCNLNIIEIEEMPEMPESNLKTCVFHDEDYCKFSFAYGYDERKKPYIFVKKYNECPLLRQTFLIVVIVIGAVLVIGICVLLVWKCVTTIHDRREFEKFELERRTIKWNNTDENPIYVHAVSTFQNPIYHKKTK